MDRATRFASHCYWLWTLAWPALRTLLIEIQQTAARVGAPLVVMVVHWDSSMSRHAGMYDFRFGVRWIGTLLTAKEQVELSRVTRAGPAPALSSAALGKDQLYLPLPDTHFATWVTGGRRGRSPTTWQGGWLPAP